MEIPDNLRCLFSARVIEERDSYILEIPDREIETGNLQEGEKYRVALLGTEPTPTEDSTQRRAVEGPEPPVEEGETALWISKVSGSKEMVLLASNEGM